MSGNTKSGNPKLTRSEHVASLSLPPSRIALTLGQLRRGDVVLRIALCVVATLLMWLITGAWVPPFPYRSGTIPARNIVARIGFAIPDPQATEQLRQQKRSEMACVYIHDDRPLKEWRSALQDRVYRILAAKSHDQVDPAVWREFAPADQPADAPAPDAEKALFAKLHAAMKDESSLTQFDRALQRAFEPFEKTGLLKGLEHRPNEGSQISILEYPLGHPDQLRRVDVADVRITEATGELKNRLQQEFRAAGFDDDDVETLVQLVDHWLSRHSLPTTLRYDPRASQRQVDEALRKIHVQQSIARGDKLAPAGTRLTRAARGLLYQEYRTRISQLTVWQDLAYSIATWGMYLALFALCGVYIYFHQPRVLRDFRQLIAILGSVVVAVALGRLCAVDAWQAEIVPVTLFGMTITIAFGRDLALLLSFVIVLVLCLTLGFDLSQFVILVATSATAILLLGRIRSRTKLIYVGAAAGAVAMLSTIGIDIMTGYACGLFTVPAVDANAVAGASPAAQSMHLLAHAAWNGGGALMAGMIMTGLLPFVERLFDIQTDISLLELGDAAHPLLQELARRAPGTYNHSITVASLAEAAAESIGAHGLLVRVGAYFHDIGKVFKPGYFIENQDRETNLHESLMPAMSTLVIIAHVKDGADLARQHRLPQSVIDFIEQHHGTTLVEYFYQQATRQKEQDPEKEEVHEGSFRYPGPKPHTRETGVLMLADAVEGACRTLVDPTPARIESLVRQIAMKRLMDGQFDKCGITLQELSTVEDSLVKSLMAVYHARVKYPDQDSE